MADATDRQAILADPLEAYRARQTQTAATPPDALSELVRERARLVGARNADQEKTGKLSRRIGAAKRARENCDELLASMREHSARLKSTVQQLEENEQAILSHFDTPAPNAEETAEYTAGNTRQYRLEEMRPDEISITLNDATADEWNRYVEANPAASLYHRAEWRPLIEETFGHAGCYFSARDDSGQLCGILPLIHLNSRLFGNFLVSMPYFNYGGAIGDHPLIEQQLMQGATTQAKALGAAHVEFRDDIARDDLPARTDKVNMLLALPETAEALWQSHTAKLRAQIRRPQRESPHVEHGGEELLDAFYAVFSRNMRDLGTPVYGKDFFRRILVTFPETASLLVIRHGGRPVAAGFLLGHRETLEIPWASSLREANPLSMNMLLYHEALNFAIAQGYRYFDFGRSSRDSGTYRFKQQWGARPRELYWHYWLASGDALPALNPSNPRYALAIRLWQRLPLAIANGLGPRLVKNLP